jgi:hypothetical protein
MQSKPAGGGAQGGDERTGMPLLVVRTVGLHTTMMNGGSASVQNARIKHCGQRGELFIFAFFLPKKV